MSETPPFLLDSRNADILDGRARRPRYNFFNGDYQPMFGCAVVFAALAIAAFMGFVLLLFVYNGQQFSQYGTTTQATISDCFTTTSSTIVSYQYEVNGSVYYESRPIAEDSCAGYVEGTALEVTYISTSPQISEINGAPNDNAYIMVATSIITLAALAFALYTARITLRTRRQFAQLEAEGVILRGRIKEVKQSQSWRGGRTIAVEYFFTTADGKKLRGKAVPQFIKEMPHSAMPVAVLFADETCFRVL